VSTKDYLEKDFYAALGVSKDASAADIKKAYRKLARQYHPDKNPGDAKAEARFKEVSEAYDVLSHDDRRKEYDETRRLFAGGGGGGGTGYAGGFNGFPPGGGSGSFDFGDLFAGGDARTARGAGGLGDLFGGLFTSRTGRSSTGGPTKGADVEAELTLDFADALSGLTAPISLSSPHTCGTCRGSGAKPGTTPRVCATCGGSGFSTRNEGAFAFSEPCRDCRGTGHIIDEPCPECGGSGVAHGVRTITVRIPAGVKDGQRIRVPGKGSPGSGGGRPGDLYVRVHVGGHPLFGRDGDNLTLTLPVTFPEAALGATVKVPTLDGAVSLKLPAGTADGRTFRVKGRGAAKAGKPGDLLVTIRVAVPAKLTAEARQALEAYAVAQPDDPRSELMAQVKPHG